jgi:hypothetical protein
MGHRAIALDADIRPEKGKHGLLELEVLEIDAGQRVPSTIGVLSGRGNGSKHFFFSRPDGLYLEDLHSPFHAVDLIIESYCVAPGSRHISGNYYRFDDDCSPLDQELASLPDFILNALYSPKRQSKTNRSHSRSGSFVEEPSSPCDSAPGRLRPDWLVRRQLSKDKIAGPLFFHGRRRHLRADGTYDRSKDDFALACKLAFYTSHHWDQYCRLWEQSALFGGKDRSDYITRTLRTAFSMTTANWTERPRKRKSRATGVKKGRRLSSDTLAVISCYSTDPAQTAVMIATRLGIGWSKVRTILSRFQRGWYQESRLKQS